MHTWLCFFALTSKPWEVAKKFKYAWGSSAPGRKCYLKEKTKIRDCLLRKCLGLSRKQQERLHLLSLISSKNEIGRIFVQKCWFLCYVSGNKFSQGWCGLTRVCVIGNVSNVAGGGVGYAHADPKGLHSWISQLLFPVPWKQLRFPHAEEHFVYV